MRKYDSNMIHKSTSKLLVNGLKLVGCEISSIDMDYYTLYCFNSFKYVEKGWCTCKTSVCVPLVNRITFIFIVLFLVVNYDCIETVETSLEDEEILERRKCTYS